MVTPSACMRTEGKGMDALTSDHAKERSLLNKCEDRLHWRETSGLQHPLQSWRVEGGSLVTRPGICTDALVLFGSELWLAT